MQTNIKKISCLVLAALSPFYLSSEEETYNNKYRAQDISLKTSLYTKDHLSFYLEADVGYRRDHINNIAELYNDLWDIVGSREQKVDLTQLNFKGGVLFYEYLFLKGAINYAFMNKDSENESSYLKGTDYLINAYQKTFSSGHTYDALVGGGVRIPLYPEWLALDAEVGYNYKKIFIKNSLEIKVSSPYVGGTLYGALGSDFQLAVYGNYFFSPELKKTAYLYFVVSDSFAPAPAIDTNHGITAYTLGLNLSYMFFDHCSVNFNWERFSSSTGVESGTFDLPVAGSEVTGLFRTQLDYWTSNQYTIGFRYTF